MNNSQSKIYLNQDLSRNSCEPPTPDPGSNARWLRRSNIWFQELSNHSGEFTPKNRCLRILRPDHWLNFQRDSGRLDVALFRSPRFSGFSGFLQAFCCCDLWSWMHCKALEKKPVWPNKWNLHLLETYVKKYTSKYEYVRKNWRKKDLGSRVCKCACVRVCACVCVRACVRACVRMCA